jgi:hypothetical protein
MQGLFVRFVAKNKNKKTWRTSLKLSQPVDHSILRTFRVHFNFFFMIPAHFHVPNVGNAPNSCTVSRNQKKESDKFHYICYAFNLHTQ